MLTISQARKLEPELETLTDEEVLEVLQNMYGIGQLAFEKWWKRSDSKNPEWLLRSNK